MATDWRNVLEDHSILQPLAKYKDRLSSVTDCKDWVAIRDGELLLWDRNTGSILSTNLKVSAAKSDSSRSARTKSVQTLSLSILPVNEVDRMVLSPSGRYLALVSKKELIVVQLPPRLSEQGLNDGKKSIMCKCISMAEYFLTTSALCLVDVAWHPGSVDDSHIVLLTADNYLRTYSIEYPSNPVESVCVQGDEEQKISEFTVRLRWAQGSSAVGFDFGSEIKLEPESRLTQDQESMVNIWPVYVLFGNGDVFKVMSSLENKGCKKPSVEGPLLIYPPSENVERNEASAILCLPGQPTVLVLASRDGQIDHCIVLDSENDEGSNDTDAKTKSVPSSSLYIYETVQLELSLTSCLNDDSVEEPFTCLMRLYKDITRRDRYLCMHNAGLHTVALSWYYKVQNFTQTERDTDLSLLLGNCPAIVEHLVCTKPLTNSVEAPLLGVTCTVYKLQSILIILSVTPEFIVVPLRASIKSTPTSSLLCQMTERKMPSPMKQVLREPFDERIQKLLQRNLSQPIIKTTKDINVSAQDCFILLSQAIQILRKEYVLKLEVVKLEIKRRLELHQEMKAAQERDIKELQLAKDILREQAQLLAEKYEAAAENHSALIQRLETVQRRLSDNSPVTSAAERHTYKELKKIQDNMDFIQSKIEQLKVKQDYQRKMLSQEQEKKHSSTPLVSKSQQQILRNLLKDQGEEIAALVKKINQLQSSMGS